MSAITLAVETSGMDGSVALMRGGELLGESWLDRAGRRHAQTLVLEARQLLGTAGFKPADVDYIATSIGPLLFRICPSPGFSPA